MDDDNKKGAAPHEGAPGRTRGEAEREHYAEHLAKVTPDADHNKALLQARYRALHGAEQDSPEQH
jgi:hypothetical protein